MPVEIMDSDGGLGNIILCRGELTEEEFVLALKKHLTKDRVKFSKYRYSLCDYTQLQDIELAARNIDMLADFCRNASVINPRAIVAIVATQDFIYGLARMWEGITDDTNWETMVFRNREDAELWLGKKAKEKYGIEALTFK